MGRTRLAAAFAIVTLYATGCAPAAESRGDDAARKLRWAEATSEYRSASSDDTLFAYERARIDRKLAEVGGKKVTEESRVIATEASPLARLEKLTTKRAEARSYGADAAVESAVVADMNAAATEAWPGVEALAQKKRFFEALALAERILIALEGKTELTARYADVKRAAIEHHEAMKRAATGNPGAELLHARLVQRAGGPTAVTTETDRLARLTWKTTLTGPPTCQSVARAITRGLRSGEGQTIELELQLASCASQRTSKTSQEPYTYSVKVPYQEQVTVTVNKEVTKTSTRQEQVCGTATHHSTGPGYGGGTYTKQDCRTETRPYTVTTTVPSTETRMVTKYRDEARSATRETTVLDFGASITGSAHAAYDGRSENFGVSASKALSDKIVKDHTGQHGPKAGVNEQRALEDAEQQVASTLNALGERVQAERAKGHADLAKLALESGDTMTAEHELVLAAIASGKAAPQGTAYFASTYGLGATELVALLAGMSPPSIAGGGSNASGTAKRTPARRAVDRDAPTEEDDERGRIGGTSPAAWAIGLENIDTETLGALSSRAMFGVTASLSIAGLSSLHTTTWGVQFLDELAVRGTLGGRTSSALTYGDGSEDGSFGYHFTAGYHALLGYRARYFGLFAGARTAARYGEIGSVAMSGVVLPLAARAELRLGGPAVITAQIWGGKMAFDHETRGADVALPIGRGPYVVRVRAEQWVLGTTSPGPTLLESSDLGRFQSTAVSAEFGAEF
jgi:hypothetical protein